MCPLSDVRELLVTVFEFGQNIRSYYVQSCPMCPPIVSDGFRLVNGPQGAKLEHNRLRLLKRTSVVLEVDGGLHPKSAVDETSPR